MNAAHLHLILNHIPIIGVPIGLAVLLWGVVGRRDAVVQVALVLFLFMAAAVIPVFVSGNGAEEVVEPIVAGADTWIEPHESAASVSLILTLALGGISLVALARSRGGALLPTPLVTALFVVAVLAIAALIWTAFAGGRIRHEEIRPGAASAVDATAGPAGPAFTWC